MILHIWSDRKISSRIDFWPHQPAESAGPHPFQFLSASLLANTTFFASNPQFLAFAFCRAQIE
jgi:hypothetical protein